MTALQLQTPLMYVKGVGQARAELLQKELGLSTCGDLLQYFPFRHVDRTVFNSIRDVQDMAFRGEELREVQLKGKINDLHVIGAKKGRRLVATLRDNSGAMELVWFNGINWVQKAIKENTTYIVYGKPYMFSGSINITHPEIENAGGAETHFSGKIQPVYTGTEKLKARGVTAKVIAKIVLAIFEQLPPETLTEVLPQHVLDKYKLIGRYDAFRNIHFPESMQHFKHAERRLKFEELFIDQIKLLRSRNVRHTASIGFIFKNMETYFNPFFEKHLEFELTGAQKRVVKEIRKDLLSGKQMNRLLQGDVGSGKTVVALLAMLMAADNHFQSFLMAPTEILAQQHYETIRAWTTNLGISVALLTGSVKGKERKEILEGIANGSIHILIGTHALIEDTVQPDNLGLVVIDEQHRFGVEQRARLWTKNNIAPHILVMTATPIPRTLSMTLYGDLDVSIIDELPPGRKDVKTIHQRENERLRVFGFLKEQIAEGRQVFIIYPLIEESAKSDLKNVMEGIQVIERDFPKPDYQVSILHGRMKPADKKFEMDRFVKKQTQIMVSTTVIEVGVNVPNATVMVIENAERFGLSQLHQLRGRVGRGAHQSFCILMTKDQISNDARLRIKTMVQTNDGFKIAEVDMQLRGPGEIEGTKQSGAPVYMIANIQTDGAILQEARITAMELLDVDPQIDAPENAVLKKYLSAQPWSKKLWGRVS
ncbi:MAG: ATP-dependent DNA helicase RecG [Chitinophagales bacterium]